MDVALSIAFLILLGLTMLKGRYVRAGIGETPLAYQSTIVQFILNISLLLFLGLSVFLIFFYSWKFFLLLLLIGFITEALIIVPLIERVLQILLNPLMKK